MYMCTSSSAFYMWLLLEGVLQHMLLKVPLIQLHDIKNHFFVILLQLLWSLLVKSGIHVPQYKVILQFSWGLKELPVHV